MSEKKEKKARLHPETVYEVRVTRPRDQSRGVHSTHHNRFTLSEDAVRGFCAERSHVTVEDLELQISIDLDDTAREIWAPEGENLRRQEVAETAREHVEALREIGWLYVDGKLMPPELAEAERLAEERIVDQEPTEEDF